jgi:alpha-tubulin suppressor-like RCC1 family protein
MFNLRTTVLALALLALGCECGGPSGNDGGTGGGAGGSGGSGGTGGGSGGTGGGGGGTGGGGGSGGGGGAMDAGDDSGVPDAGQPNLPPAATADPGAHWLRGQRFVFDGGGVDPEGAALTYSWAQVSGPTAALAGAGTRTPSFVPRRAGTYVYALIVSDGDAGSAPANVTVPVHDINGGSEHTVALKPDGTLWAWGQNFTGELGNGTMNPSDVPTRVCDLDASVCTTNPLTGVVAISVGRAHTLALRSNGTVVAWGYNFNGELGDGTFDVRYVPVPVCEVGATNPDGGLPDCTATPLSNVVQIAAGYLHSVALKADGTVVSWGYNNDSELGNGNTAGNETVPGYVCAPGAVAPCTPANANVLGSIAMVTAGGGGHALAQATSGELYAWGHNKGGQCGNGDSFIPEIPVAGRVCAPGQTAACTQFLSNVASFDVWSGHSLVLDQQGGLWGWGGNNDGELGMVTSETCALGSTCTSIPRAVCATSDFPCTTPLTNVRNFSAGRRFSTATLNDGTVLAWGDNTYGQLGDTTVDGGIQPRPVCAPGQTSAPCPTRLSNISGVTNGNFQAMALARNGTLYVWGDNSFMQLGLGPDAGLMEPTPRPVPGY